MEKQTCDLLFGPTAAFPSLAWEGSHQEAGCTFQKEKPGPRGQGPLLPGFHRAGWENPAQLRTLLPFGGWEGQAVKRQ